MAIFSTVSVSGIEMGPFHFFSLSAACGNLNGTLCQSYDELALVFRRSSHVRLRIGGSTRGFGGSGHCFVVEDLSAKRRLGFGGADGGQTDAAESNRYILTNVSRQVELHSHTGARIHGSGPLKGKIGSAAALRRNLHYNFGYKLFVSERGGVGVCDEVAQRDRTRAVCTEAVNGGVQRDQGIGPIAARIGFRQRSA